MNKLTNIGLIKFGLIKVLGALSGIIFTSVITNSMTQDDSGNFFYYITIAAVLAVFFRYGGEIVLIKIATTQLKEVTSTYLFKSCLKTLFIFLFVLMLISFLIRFEVLVKKESMLLYLAVISGFLLALNQLLSAAFLGVGKKKNSVFMVTVFPMGILSFILFIEDNLGIEEALVYYMLVFLVTFLIFAYRWTLVNCTGGEVNKEIFATRSNIIFQIGIFDQLITWLPIIFIQNTLGPLDVAAYTVVLKIAMTISFALSIVNNYYVSEIAKLYSDKNIVDLKNLYHRTVKVSTMISSIMSIAVLIFSDFILSVFGSEYLAYKNVLYILVFAQIINSVTGPVGYMLTMTNNEVNYRNIMMLSTVIMVSVAMVLSETINLEDVAVIYLAAILIQNMASYYYTAKFLGS